MKQEKYPHDGNRPFPLLRIEGREFQVLKQLSLLERGRWLIRDAHPRPRGTLFTAIIVEDTPASRQLERTLYRLKTNVNGIPHLVMKGYHQNKKVWVITWQEGNDLESYLREIYEGRLRRPSVWESIRRIKSLAHSLKIVNDRCQIIHADIKPPNLVLQSPGAIALIDYGSSWQTERTVCKVEGDGRLAAYSAPELLFSNQSIDSRADQFSTAVVLYELLTLHLPYMELGGKAGLPPHRVDVEGKYVPPSGLIPQNQRIPKSILTEMDFVVGKALKLDADQRFGTAQEFCDALEAVWYRLKGCQDSIASGDAKPNLLEKAIKWFVTKFPRAA